MMEIIKKENKEKMIKGEPKPKIGIKDEKN